MPRTSRTFRVFVSSTFSDLKAERNALHERVFPRLRELCQAHGCRFQAIDLRWGVSEEAALDQQTMNICLGEIERRLHATLLKAARELAQWPDELLKYTASATEQEILAGALRVADAADHVFCYFREIEDLPQDDAAAGFIDLDGDGEAGGDGRPPGSTSAP